jgi:hypothetical protein
MRLVAVREHDIAGLASLGDVAFAQALLQLLSETHLAAHTLKPTAGRLAERVSALGAKECHRVLTATLQSAMSECNLGGEWEV